MLMSDLCDYNDAANENCIDLRNRILAFKNNAPFTDCISKINGALIDNAENLDVVMPM